MQQKIQQFIVLCEKLLLETGELRVRQSWSDLSEIASQLSSSMKPLSQNLSTKYAILFLLSCGNESPQKKACFSMLFRKILSKTPSQDIFNVLSVVNKIELNNYIIPFIYEKGNIGSIATYVSAKLDLKIKIDYFEYFLNSREWDEKDLINLSLLVLEIEKENLIQRISEISNSNPSESLSLFLDILKSKNNYNPIVPNILTSNQQEIPVTINKPIIRRNDSLSSNQNMEQQQNFSFKLTGNNRQSANQNLYNFDNPQGSSNQFSPSQPLQQGNPNQFRQNIPNQQFVPNQFPSNQPPQQGMPNQYVQNVPNQQFAPNQFVPNQPSQQGMPNQYVQNVPNQQFPQQPQNNFPTTQFGANQNFNSDDQQFNQETNSISNLESSNDNQEGNTKEIIIGKIKETFSSLDKFKENMNSLDNISFSVSSASPEVNKVLDFIKNKKTEVMIGFTVVMVLILILVLSCR